ncbi:MAG: hypothetical protein KDC35_20120 [Acidobacteria bacterium]|nr:hypothetical protein [Acidobacteriota bacterium]
MINLSWSIGAALLIGVGLALLDVHLAISIPLGLLVGLALFVWLGRKTQEKLETIMAVVQKDIQAQKIDRAIEALKGGMRFKHQHIFVEAQLNSQIGMLYYIKKDHESALPYLKKGFLKHYIGACMQACIYYKRKDYAQMKSTMQDAVKANSKESIVYALFAYLLQQIKEPEEAIAIMQKGLKKIPDDEKLTANLILLQNQKKMKMKAYGELWLQFMLERPPRVMQGPPQHVRYSKKAMFR